MNTSTMPTELLQQAASQLQAGRLNETANTCQKILEDHPGQPDALHMLAMAAATSQRFDEAEQLFLETIKHAPKRPDILVNFGNFLRNLGRLSEAQVRMRKAVKVAPEFSAGWYNLGMLLHASFEMKEAASCARKALKLEPTHAAAWELLASAEQKQGNADAAIQACRDGLVQIPDSPRLTYAIAQLLRQECEFSESVTAYQAALEQGYRNPELYANMGESLEELGEMDRAVACLDSGLTQFPDSANLHRTRAHLAFSSGAEGDPLVSLREATRAYPDNPQLWYTLARLLDRLDRKDESAQVIADARAAGTPDAPELAMQEALCRNYQGKPDEATALFEKMVAAYPNHVDGRLTYAGHLLAHGDPKDAEQHCATVIDEQPFNQLAWCYAGTAWELMGDERAQWLMDYERMVRPVVVPPPAGHSTTESFFEEVQAALEELHHTQARPIEQSVRGGTQTNGFLFRLKHPLLATVEQQIRLAIKTALADLPQERDHPFWSRKIADPRGDGFQFSGAWSVRLLSEGFHTNHIHTEGWISSALYVALPDEVKAGDDTSGHIQFGVPMTELELDLPAKRVVKPEVGTLVLFPSYMWHGTIPFQSEQPRMTIAFDLIPQL